MAPSSLPHAPRCAACHGSLNPDDAYDPMTSHRWCSRCETPEQRAERHRHYFSSSDTIPMWIAAIRGHEPKPEDV